MILIASRPCIVCSEETWRAVTVIEFADVCNTGQNVVARIIGIGAKTMSNAQVSPCLGHDLHQPDSALSRPRSHIRTTLDAHHCTYPMFRYSETPGRFRSKN